ncbi:MAG: hypothetical protein DCF16_18950 [Alphaproteobacteria bacterium]|nr:MAG: hypothetical protein DCF16_18950 [Alphaproteobacteria bacterium]
MNSVLLKVEHSALLCLNVRREHAHLSSDVSAALVELAAVLRQARQRGAPVLHAYARVPRKSQSGYGALPGLEPLANEPVFALSGLSALAEPAILEHGAGGLLLAGGVFSRAGLASALAAQEQGIDVAILAKACFTPCFDGAPAAQIIELANSSASARGAKHAALEASWGENVVCLDRWRT